MYPFCAFLCPRGNGGILASLRKGMAGTTRLELATSAVTEHLDLEFQGLTGSSKEHKVVKTRRREFLLFPDCSHDAASDSETKFADGLAPTRGEREITWSWFYKELRGSRWTEMEGLSILRHSHCRPFAASFSHPTFLLGGSISRTLLFASRMASDTACL